MRVQRVTLDVPYDTADCDPPDMWDWGELCDHDGISVVAAEAPREVGSTRVRSTTYCDDDRCPGHVRTETYRGRVVLTDDPAMPLAVDDRAAPPQG